MEGTKYFIDKQYLIDALASFNKQVLVNQYADIDYAKDIRSDLDVLTGKYTGKDIVEIMDSTDRMIKVFVTDYLPDAGEANPCGIYILHDSNATNEACKQYIYMIKKVDNVQKWVCVSSPSYLLETDDIDFTDAFKRAKVYYTKQNVVNYLNYNYLETAINNSGLTKSIGLEVGSLPALSIKFIENNNIIEGVALIGEQNLYILNMDMSSITSETTSIYKTIPLTNDYDLNNFAQTVINEGE